MSAESRRQVKSIAERLGIPGVCKTFDEAEPEGLSGNAQRPSEDAPVHDSRDDAIAESSRPAPEAHGSVRQDWTILDRISAFVERFVFFQG